jgi:hypothetical protein
VCVPGGGEGPPSAGDSGGDFEGSAGDGGGDVRGTPASGARGGAVDTGSLPDEL